MTKMLRKRGGARLTGNVNRRMKSLRKIEEHERV